MTVAVSLTLWLILVLSVSSQKTFKGINMCRGDCEKTKGCKSIHYDPVHLECTLLFDKENTAETTSTVVIQAVTQTNAVRDLVKNCKKNERLIDTRRNIPSCVLNAAMKGEYGEPSLLLSASVNKLFKVNVNTLIVEEVPFPWTIHCVTYWKTEKRFLLGVDDEIISTPTTQNKRTLIKSIGVQNILIDEDVNLIFGVSTARRKRHISRMNTRGEHFRSIKRMLAFHCESIEIDQRRRLIYIAVPFHLQSLNYSGYTINDRALPSSMSNLDFVSYNAVKDTMYLAAGLGIYVVVNRGSALMQNGRVESSVHEVCSMTVKGKYLFVSDCFSPNAIHRIDTTDNSEDKILVSREKDKNGDQTPFKLQLMLN